MSLFKKGDKHEIEKSIKRCEEQCRNIEQLIETKCSNIDQLLETKYSNLDQLIETKCSNFEKLIETKCSNLEQLIETKYINVTKTFDNDTNIYDYLKKLELQLVSINETVKKDIILKSDQAPLINVINNMSQNFTNLLVQIHNDLKIDLKSNLKNNDTCDEKCIKQLISESNDNLLSNISIQNNKYLNHVIDVNNQLTKNIKDLEQVMLNVDKNINSFYFENELIKNQLHLAEEINKWSDEVNTIRDLAIQCKQSVEEILNNCDINTEC
jgi:hypothetical protein